ncbi:MAG: hypothetical protein ACE5GD_09855 [Candidatus Geothermarchaeales archaeon]
MTVKFKYVGRRKMKFILRGKRFILRPGKEYDIPDKYADKIRKSPYYSKIFQESPLEDRVERLECVVRLIVKELGLDVSECV